QIVVEETSCFRDDGSEMLIQVTRPLGPGPFPAMVDIHGGGWVAGDRHTNRAIVEKLAQGGVVVASPEFRKPPDGVYPVPIADIHLGIRWLKANAARYGASPERVGGLGTSS